MKDKIFYKYILLVIRLFLGFIFLYAAITKIAEPDAFAISIKNYKLIPEVLTNLFAVVLPWVELSSALLLIFGISVRENSAIISALLIIFIAAIFISVLRGLDIECGCFGTADGSKVGILKILENFGLLLLGIILIKYNSSYLSLKQTEK